ncbi:MAG: hypothetical protein IPP14_11400 [Planctomycetes bacterium]|nr:hypothetical protein [Planctomycetota bacterium]
MSLSKYLRTPDGDSTPGKMVFIALSLLLMGLAVGVYGLSCYLHWHNIERHGQLQKGQVIFARTQTVIVLDYAWDRYYLTARFPAGETGATQEVEVLPAEFEKYKNASLTAPIEAMAIVYGPSNDQWALQAQLPFEYGVASLVATVGSLGGMILMCCALLGCWYQYWRPSVRNPKPASKAQAQIKP